MKFITKKMCLKCFFAAFSLLVVAGMVACSESEEGLTLEPAFVVLTPSSNTVSFLVTGAATNATFATPITWTVVNPALGEIVGSSGFRALYRTKGIIGDNIVIARDGLDNEGFASVKQIADPVTEEPAPETDTTAAAATQ